MNILAFESSCDETSVGVVRGGRVVLSNIIASQTELHALYGGVVPEIASRRHAECIHQLTEQALERSGLTFDDIDAVACTTAPGLIGALLVGTSFAKALAFSLGLPFVPVHHIRGHVAANYLVHPELKPPFTALVVSGGHSSILHVTDYTEYKTLGITLDDAAGECFDKVARTLGLGYPGGAALDRLAQGGDPGRYALPRSKVEGLNMSFSGLKTAVLNTVHNARQRGEDVALSDLAASFSQAVCDVLIARLLSASDLTGCNTLVLAGGVASNSWIRRQLQESADGRELYMPPRELCGDNAAMIGAQGFFELKAGKTAGLSHNARATCPADINLC